jgi:DNA transposition AAA+ family ATPase
MSAALDFTAPAQPDMTGWLKERRLLWRAAREDGVALSTIAEAAGVSRPLLSQFLNYDEHRATKNLLTALRDYFKTTGRWDESAARAPGAALREVRELETIDTETFRRVWYVLEATADNRNFGMVSGPSGCGKTLAVRRWLERSPEGAVYLAATPCLTRKNLLRRLANELGVLAKGDADAILERLCVALAASPRLIIIDEADQICGESRLETLRALIDNSENGAGIVLIGNEDLAEHILRLAIDKRKLSRIHNRFGANQRVAMPTEAEAQRWLSRVNLTDGARRLLIAIIRRPGGMGGFRVAQSVLKTLFKAVGDQEITEELLRSDGLRNAVLSLNA